ncbi:redoxin domain-containing protein, partial [bacterium]
MSIQINPGRNRLYRILSLASAGLSLFCAVSNVDAQDVAKPPVVGETAPDFELEELKGEKVKLSNLAVEGPVVLVMLRGFPGYQCPFCTAQVGQLLDKADEFKQANARVLMVYPGPAKELKEHADEFVRGKDMPDNFYLALDPDYDFTN